jgi:hypothetical protein
MQTHTHSLANNQHSVFFIWQQPDTHAYDAAHAAECLVRVL